MQLVRVDGLDPREQAAVEAALKVITAQEPSNTRRALYADAKVTQHLDGWTAAQFGSVRSVLGWPAKAVRTLSTLCRNEGVTSSDGVDHGMGDWWDDNNLRVEASQAQDLSLIYGPAFLVTTAGDPGAGEPDVVTTIKQPTLGTGVWNGRSRRLEYFLSINATTSPDGSVGGSTPSEMVLYLPGVTVLMARDGVSWMVERRPTTLPFVPVHPLIYQGRPDRVFGSSRVSPPVMSITDNAIRSVMRAEAGAQAYINPQRYLLGADMTQFADENGVIRPDLVWRAVLGQAVAIGVNDENEEGRSIVPTAGQFPQLDMTPHLDQLESYARQFAAETDVPPSAMGVTNSQNPASAEAILADYHRLILLAEKTQLEWSSAWENAAMTAFMLREGLTARPDGVRFRSKWRDARTFALAAQADAMVKLTGGDRPIIPPTSDFALERLGLSDAEIERVQADRRRDAGRSVLADIAAKQGAA